jgi:5'(3')-deoxyribonucleotidase
VKLFLDFDEVLADSIEAVLQILNKRYNKNIKFEEVKVWNFNDVFPEIHGEEISQLFDENEFWDVVCLKRGAYKFVEYALTNPLIEDITIVSIGRKNNLINKEKFVEKIWGDKVKFIGIYSHECTMDKSCVDMSGGIFIDDNENNLFSSNAEFKLLFKNIEDAEWNSQWKGDYVRDFDDLKFYLNLMSFVYIERYENGQPKTD